MGNLHVLNTINLHQHMRAMEDGTMLGNLGTIETENSTDTKEAENPFHFLPPSTEGPQFKDYISVKNLRPSTAHSLLKHAVIVLLAHTGLDSSSEIAIETLTDVADHFLRRMALLLKVASEQKEDGFPDPVERVLVEAGVGGVVALHDYYQENVLKVEENMRNKVEGMLEKQRQQELNANSTKIDLDEVANKLKFEELDEFGNMYRDVPTLQLLDPEMGFPPNLDAGFQMLHSLEQEELNSLEVEEEEVNVSDSPNTGQRPELIVDKKKK
ncbi:STAGA complex 65 subunit gamma isoform X2 [Cephus cinctus]|nr:STAGA complex 65 subunit gamma isoform X2 [Cephus cinctus]